MYISIKVYTDLIPENLRALNLAAFEIVDFVIIDKNPEPYEILKKLNQITLQKVMIILGSENKKTQI